MQYTMDRKTLTVKLTEEKTRSTLCNQHHHA
jgi:hypothetical protein